MLRLESTTATRFHHTYTHDSGLRATIIMNPRDAMVFANVEALSDVTDMNAKALSKFTTLLTANYGGKSVLAISPTLYDKIPVSTLMPGAFDARFISTEAVTTAVAAVAKKQHVAEQLAKFTSGEYTLLTKTELVSRLEELSEFKITHSSFADETKIERGQYGTSAERDKLANPYVKHYAIEHQGKIIACSMLVTHERFIYASDTVVHADYRSASTKANGLCQAFFSQLYTKLRDELKTGIWFIAGGYGGLTVGEHLYGRIFPATYLKTDLSLQRALHFYLMFGAPKSALLQAANRDLTTSRVIGEDDDVQKAIAILHRSNEKRLAASQPAAATSAAPAAERVVGMSLFSPTASLNIDHVAKATTPFSAPK